MFASLPCPLATATATTTIPTTLSSSSSSSSPKALSRRRVQVSCNASNGDQNQNNGSNIGKFDRRNLLVGLGGLYGAANLGSNKPASAAPIPPPDFRQCLPPTDQITPEVHEYVNCCPPLPCDGEIIDYKLPAASIKRFRPSAHEVTPKYISKYNRAVELMKRLPLNDPRSFWQQANVHCAYCNETYQYGDGLQGGKQTIQVHACWLFFPFHRWYLYFYERILGSLIDDPSFGLPFWHWDSPRGVTVPPMYLNQKSALFNQHRNEEHMHSLVTLSMQSGDHQSPSQTIANNLKIMNDEMIRNAKNLEGFMGKRYSFGDKMNPGAGAVERGCHTAVHVFVGDPKMPYGEDMGNFYSTGREPMFFAHHANLDRLWSVWRDLRSPGQPKDFTDRDYLDAEFLFYDEKSRLVRVRVGDCLDQERMGYYYQRVDNPWIHYRSPSRLQKSTAVTTSNAPKLDEQAFPLKLDKTVTVVVPRPEKQGTGEQDEEVLLIQDIEFDKGTFVKFDVFVNDEDENVDIIDRAEYAGTFSHVPHKHEGEMTMKTSITLRLKELFEDLGVDDEDDAVLVSLVPKAGDVTIGGIEIIYDSS